MSEKHFGSFVREQSKNLEGVARKIKEVREDLGKTIEKNSEKLAGEIDGVFGKEKSKLSELSSFDEVYDFMVEEILPQIPPIPPPLLEKTLQKIIRRYENKEYNSDHLGLLLSALINRTVIKYVNAETKRVKRLESIKALKIRLSVKDLPGKLNLLGYKNQEKCYLTVEGDMGNRVGYQMSGGKIAVEGNVLYDVGSRMSGGVIEVRGNAGGWVGVDMSAGRIEVGGRVEFFDDSLYLVPNQAIIVWKGVEVLKGGRLTKEGMEMMREGKISFQSPFP